MKDIFGMPLSIFTVIWNIVDWESVNIVFTVIISILTVVYMIFKIRCKYYELKERKGIDSQRLHPWRKRTNKTK